MRIKKIKVLIINIILFFFASYGFAQMKIDNLMIQKAPNCEDIAYNSANLIIKYCNKQDYDSAKIVLDYWQSKCGNCEPIVRTKILLAIKHKTFNENIYDTTIVDYVINYMNRMEVIRPEYTYNYYKFYFGFVPIKGDYDNFTQKIANELISEQKENSIELLYCKFYANLIKNPINEIQNSSVYDKTNLKSFYLQIVKKYINIMDIHGSVFTGIWIPTGNAKLLGNHPLLGFQMGARNKKMTYNLTLAFKFLDSQNEYYVLKDGKIDTTKHFFGGYFAIDVERELFKFNKNQIDILAGIGYDGFDAISYNNNNNNSNSNNNGVSIGSLNMNIGLGYKYYFRKKGYIGLQGKYNFVNFTNSGGTNLSGNCITISLLIGGFGNKMKDENLKALRYND